ncbi:hypothetical protein C8R44DRAFT_727180 [Mycena epipterygia]|nr:hypothetical protein C8R44DRAFT_727180 [Mycena epipterygia]
MDVDGGSIEQIDIPPRQINVPPLQKHVPGTPDISEATIFPNHFLDLHEGNLYRQFGALIITGLPGIGKTVLLVVIVWLRVAANPRTTYMANPNIILVYTDTHFFVLHAPVWIPAAPEQNSWFLFDSTANYISEFGVVLVPTNGYSLSIQ